MKDLFDFGLGKGSIRSKRCSISGTIRRASSIRSGRITEVSISFDKKHQRPIDRGSWFRFVRRDRSEAWQLANASDPYLPSVEYKIENADEDGGSCQKVVGISG
jgi:hypothetical protein